MLNLYIPIEGGEHDDFCFWEFAANRRNLLHPRTTLQTSIHEGYVGPMSTKLLDRLSGVRGLCDVQHVRLRRNNHAKTFPIHGHVVNCKDSDLSRHRAIPFP